MASSNPPWSDEGDKIAMARPYVLSGGRTEARHLLDLRTYVKATGQAEQVLHQLTPQHLKVLDACRCESITVGDVVAAAPYALQVVRILISDLIEKGALVHRLTVVAGEGPSTEILQKVYRGLSNLDVSSRSAKGGTPGGHAC